MSLCMFCPFITFLDLLLGDNSGLFYSRSFACWRAICCIIQGLPAAKDQMLWTKFAICLPSFESACFLMLISHAARFEDLLAVQNG